MFNVFSLIILCFFKIDYQRPKQKYAWGIDDLVESVIIVIIDKCLDLHFEACREEVGVQKDAFLES